MFSFQLQTLTILCFTFALLSSQTASAQTQYYVNQNNPGSTGLGTKDDPFGSLSDAFSSTSSGPVEIILLGESITVNGAIEVTNPINYDIKPLSIPKGGSYFPMTFQNGDFISLTGTTLTLQKIQIIMEEQDDPFTGVFTLADKGTLIFQNILMSNHSFSFGSGTLVSAFGGEISTVFQMIGCDFSYNDNLGLFFQNTELLIKDSIFLNNRWVDTPPFLIYNDLSGIDSPMTFQNITIQDAIFNSLSGGFVVVSNYSKAIIFDGFHIKNASMIDFASVISSQSYDIYDPLPISLKNGIIEDSSVPSQTGYIFSLSGPLELVVANLTIRNCQNTIIFSCLSGGDENGSYMSSGTLEGITVQNSNDTTFVFYYFDTINFSNILLENGSFSVPRTSEPLIIVSQTTNAFFKNFYSRTYTGTIITIDQTLNQYMEDFVLIDCKHSQKAPPDQQLLIRLTRNRQSDPYKWNYWTGMTDESQILLRNFTINGFTDVDGIEATQDANNTYALSVTSEFGKVYIREFHFYEVEMGGIFISYSPHLEVDGFVVETNPLTPTSEIAKHRIIQLLEVTNVSILNSRFINDRNVLVLNFYHIRRMVLMSEIIESSLLLQNVTAINNKAVYTEIDGHYPALFTFRSPLNPANIIFKDSYIQGSVISTGVILTDESAQIDLTLLNNIFKDNLAYQAGGVLSASSMKNGTSIINMQNNIFLNNSCLGSGGVISFIATNHKIISVNNTYLQNWAAESGGVGYVIKTDLQFSEVISNYQDNSADSFGGAWYLSFTRLPNKEPQVNFTQTNFIASQAESGGGALYIETGDITFAKCRFQENKDMTAGGDIYLLALASLIMTDTQSISSSAPAGSFLYAEAITDEVVTIQNTQVTGVSNDKIEKTVITMNAGSLITLNSVFDHIASSLFEFQGVSIIMQNTQIENIICSSSKGYCLMSGANTNLNIGNLTANDITSNVDLVSFIGTSSYISVDNLKILNVDDGQGGNIESTELFSLSFKDTNKINLTNSEFRQIKFSSIKAISSDLSISNCIFSNAESERRLQVAISPDSDDYHSRFVVADSSNLVIEDSQFLQNSYCPVSNGGAVAFTATGEILKISRSTFEGNNGLIGGALLLQGILGDTLIEDSNFISNTATEEGGAIFFLIEDGSVIPVIDTTTFEQNSGISGGAVYAQNSSLLLKHSLFTKNYAQAGAGLASKTLNPQKISFENVTFSENTAKVGSALMAFGDLNFGVGNSIFTGNTATEGSNINTVPNSLGLRVYQVDEAFLYLDDVPIDYIKAHYNTQIIYDSEIPALQISLMMKTGKAPNYLFEFIVLDKLRQQISTINSIQLTLDQVRATSDQNRVSLYGKTQYMFNTYPGDVFNSFSVRGNVSSAMTLLATAQVVDSLSLTLYNLPALTFPITIGTCAVGEIFDQSSLVCNPCSRNSFSFGDPYTTETCELCPVTAVCRGGNTVYPSPGYWRMSATSNNFVKCQNEDACIGGERDQGRDISLTGFCDTGYEGVGCSVCSEGYVRHGSNYECMSCSRDFSYHIRYVAFLFIQVGLAVFTIRSHIMSSSLNEKDRKAGILQSSLIKVIIDFIHVVNLTLAFNVDWPTQVLNFLDLANEVAPNNKDVFSLECIISIVRGNNQNIFFIKLVILVVQPIVFILISYIVWVIIYRMKRRQITESSEFKSHLFLTTVVIIYILQPDIIKSTFQLFNCQNFASLDDPQYFLIEDTNVECWKSHHVVWVLSLGIPSLVIWLILPSLAMIYLITRKDLTNSGEFRLKYNFIFEKYQRNRFYWDIVILARKVILIIFVVFLSLIYLQAYLSFVLLIFAFGLQFKVQPYSHKKINYAELISLYVSASIMYTGLFFVRDDAIQDAIPWLLAFDIIMGVGFFCYCLYVAKTIIGNKMRRIVEKLDKIIEADNFKWKNIKKMYQCLKRCPKRGPKAIPKEKLCAKEALENNIPYQGSLCMLDEKYRNADSDNDLHKASTQAIVSHDELGLEILKSSQKLDLQANFKIQSKNASDTKLAPQKLLKKSKSLELMEEDIIFTKRILSSNVETNIESNIEKEKINTKQPVLELPSIDLDLNIDEDNRNNELFSRGLSNSIPPTKIKIQNIGSIASLVERHD